METFILSLVEKYPSLSTVVMAVGVFRLTFKPLMTFLETVIKATPATGDDAALEKFKSGKIYKSLSFVVDYLLSIKLSQARDDGPKP